MLENLTPNKDARKAGKRLGRGIGSGLGKTSGKGHKGQWARSGGGVRPGFEGGQMPLIRRVPKRGFNNAFAKEYSIINISDLEIFEKGLLSKVENYGVKVLGNGALTKSLTVQAQKFTKSAAEKIEQAGGKAEVL